MGGPYGPGRPSEYTPSRKEGSKPPSGPGEYRIISNTGKIKYIGETCDLNRRMNEHRNTGKIANGNTYAWKSADGRSTSNTRREHEKEKIGKHNPPLNKSGGGEGRPAARR